MTLRLRNKWLGLAVLVTMAFVLITLSATNRASDLPPLKVVVMADFPPLIYTGSGGVIRGMIPERWALWQQKTGRRVEVTGMEWSDALAEFRAGRFDVIDAITLTPEREQELLFSAPWITLDVMLYYHESMRGISDLESARGFMVGAVKGDACVDFLQRQGIDNLALFPDYPELVGAAVRGGVSVFCGHQLLINYYLGLRGQADRYRHTAPLYSAPGHWAVLKHRPALLEEVEQGFGLISAAEDKALHDKWLGKPLFEPATPAWVGWLLYSALGLFLLLVIVLVWLRMLRRLVGQRTHALAESEERFRMLFENTRQPIALIENGYFIAANRATLDMLKMQRFAELEGQTPLDISPEIQPGGERSAVAILSLLGKAAAEGSVRAEWQHTKADGEQFIAEVMLTTIRRDEREILHVVWNDVTARKQAEHELQQYRTHLEELVDARTQELSRLAQELRDASSEQQALFDAAMAGIVFVRDRKVLSCNRYLEQMFGYEPGELLGQTTRAWYPDEYTFFEVGEHVIEAHAQQGFFSEERQLVRKDGSRFWARMQAQAIDPNDLGKGVAGMVIDITAEREAMSQMEHARALAEEAARTKADFLANMSHEIRTPMNAIMGMTHLVLQTELNERQRDYLQKIQRSSKHLLGIINDVLDFSKMEAGKLSLEQVEFSLQALLGELSDSLLAKTEEKGLKLKVQVDESLPDRLLGDPLRLQQILLNFGNNAVKFTERGEISIRVVPVENSSGRLCLKFSVEDTGIGLSQTQQLKLFRSFEQADGSTTRKYGGSGLGLAISRRLAEMMGGKVGVVSHEGVGSTFWFVVELEAASVQPEIKASGRAETRKTRADARHHVRELKQQLEGARVLLVEDNDLNQEVAVALLEQVGIKVDIAANGAEALEALARKEYDLILMDMQMPVMDGLTATRRLRKQEQFRELPILAMTASVLPGDRAACMEAGMNDYLSKPIEPDQLWRCLQRWITSADQNSGINRVPDDTVQVDETVLPDIDGLDTVTGLTLALDDMDLYRRLLQSFVNGHRGFNDQLGTALQQDEAEQAIRLVHTLKGSAGQVGASTLAALAQDYEQQLRQAYESKTALPGLNPALADGLQVLLDQLTEFFTPAIAKQAAAVTSDGAWSESDTALFLQLNTLLSTDDFRAGRLLADEADCFRRLLGKYYPGVVKAAESFDFARAAALMQVAAGSK
ncbi:two-component system sensor histidine kinase/response regulator [Marinobacterium sp. MBR-109]|jgi:two-component system sensor histidine kinase/response regulator